MRYPNALMLLNNEYYGLDSRHSLIKLDAFTPLKLIKSNDTFSVVKRYGRGQVRTFLVANNLLEPYRTIHEWFWGIDNTKEETTNGTAGTNA